MLRTALAEDRLLNNLPSVNSKESSIEHIACPLQVSCQWLVRLTDKGQARLDLEPSQVTNYDVTTSSD